MNDITNYAIDRDISTYPNATNFQDPKLPDPDKTVYINSSKVCGNSCSKKDDNPWPSTCASYGYNFQANVYDQYYPPQPRTFDPGYHIYTLQDCYKNDWNMSPENKTDCCLSGKPGEPIYGKPGQTIQPYQCRPDLYRFSKACNDEMVEYCAVSSLDSKGNCVPFANDKSVCGSEWYGNSVTNNINMENKINLLANFCKGYKLNEPWCSNEPTGISYGNFIDNTEHKDKDGKSAPLVINYVKKYIMEQPEIDTKNPKNTPYENLVSNIRGYCKDNMDTDFCTTIAQNWNSSDTSGIFVKYGDGYRNILHDNLVTYCNIDDNITKDICKNFYSTNVNPNDSNTIGVPGISVSKDDKINFGKIGGYGGDKLVDWCSKTYCQGSGDNITCDIDKMMLNKDTDICGCMLPKDFYDKVSKSFSNNFIPSDNIKAQWDAIYNRKDCNFFPCLNSEYIFRQSCRNGDSATDCGNGSEKCPANQICLNKVEYNINGDIIDSQIINEQGITCNFGYNIDTKYKPEDCYIVMNTISDDNKNIKKIHKCEPDEYVSNNICNKITSSMNQVKDPCNCTKLCSDPAHCGAGTIQSGNIDKCDKDNRCGSCGNPFINDTNIITNDSHTLAIQCSTIEKAKNPCANSNNCLKTDTTGKTCEINSQVANTSCNPGTIIKKSKYIEQNITNIKGIGTDIDKPFEHEWEYEYCTDYCDQTVPTVVDSSHRVCIPCPSNYITDNTKSMCLPADDCPMRPYSTKLISYIKDGQTYYYKQKICDNTTALEPADYLEIIDNGCDDCPKAIIKQCQNGEIANINRSGCQKDPMTCSPGFYLDPSNPKECQECPSGITNLNRTSCEKNCNAGEGPDVDGFKCEKCPDGKISINGKCKNCNEFEQYKGKDNLIPSYTKDRCIYDYTKCALCKGFDEDNLGCNVDCKSKNSKSINYTIPSNSTDSNFDTYIKCQQCDSGDVVNEDCSDCVQATQFFSYDKATNKCNLDTKGTYTTIVECENENIKYDCNNDFKCVKRNDGNAGKILSECTISCKKPIIGYRCVNKKCYPVNEGSIDFKTLEECQKSGCEGISPTPSSKTTKLKYIIGGIGILIILIILGIFLYKKYRKN
jgi:hypothetical protein